MLTGRRNYQILTEQVKTVVLVLDITVIFSALLSKIEHYDDLKGVVYRMRNTLAILERDLCTIAAKGMRKFCSMNEDQMERLLDSIDDILLRTFEEFSEIARLVMKFFTSFPNLQQLWISSLERDLNDLKMVAKSDVRDRTHAEYVSEVNVNLELLLNRYTRVILGKFVLLKDLRVDECVRIRRRRVCTMIEEMRGVFPLRVD